MTHRMVVLSISNPIGENRLGPRRSHGPDPPRGVFPAVRSLAKTLLRPRPSTGTQRASVTRHRHRRTVTDTRRSRLWIHPPPPRLFLSGLFPYPIKPRSNDVTCIEMPHLNG